MRSLNEKLKLIEELKSKNLLENQAKQVENTYKRKQLKNIVDENKSKIHKELIEKEKREHIDTKIISYIELKKGFSIVGKPKPEKILTGFNHEFYTIKSDVDNIMSNQKDDLT